MVFEYCSKGDLHTLIQSHRARKQHLSERQILQLVAQIAGGVQHLHAHGVIHRDIKSLNVVLDATASATGGEELTAKICDLGVSRLMSEETIFLQTFCGTPAYLSPEVVRSQPYTEKVDVWSLGVIAYELGSLRLPFLGRDLMEMSNMISKGEFAPLPDYLSSQFRSLVSEMLCADAERRPSVQQVLQTSKELLADRYGLSAGAEASASTAAAAAAAAGDSARQHASRPPEQAGGERGSARERASSSSLRSTVSHATAVDATLPYDTTAAKAEGSVASVGSSVRELRLQQRAKEREGRVSTASSASSARGDVRGDSFGVDLNSAPKGMSEKNLQAYVLAQQMAAYHASAAARWEPTTPPQTASAARDTPQARNADVLAKISGYMKAQAATVHAARPPPTPALPFGVAQPRGQHSAQQSRGAQHERHEHNAHNAHNAHDVHDAHTAHSARADSGSRSHGASRPSSQHSRGRPGSAVTEKYDIITGGPMQVRR